MLYRFLQVVAFTGRKDEVGSSFAVSDYAVVTPFAAANPGKTFASVPPPSSSAKSVSGSKGGGNRLCKYWLNTGRCPRSEACPYKHGSASEQDEGSGDLKRARKEYVVERLRTRAGGYFWSCSCFVHMLLLLQLATALFLQFSTASLYTFPNIEACLLSFFFWLLSFTLLLLILDLQRLGGGSGEANVVSANEVDEGKRQEDNDYHDFKSRHRRASLFAEWLLREFPSELSDPSSAVADVAGGRGELAFELKARLRAAARVVVVDPRECGGGVGMGKKWQRKMLRKLREEQGGSEAGMPERMTALFDQEAMAKMGKVIIPIQHSIRKYCVQVTRDIKIFVVALLLYKGVSPDWPAPR